jgi:hypothetical protein
MTIIIHHICKFSLRKYILFNQRKITGKPIVYCWNITWGYKIVHPMSILIHHIHTFSLKNTSCWIKKNSGKTNCLIWTNAWGNKIVHPMTILIHHIHTFSIKIYILLNKEKIRKTLLSNLTQHLREYDSTSCDYNNTSHMHIFTEKIHHVKRKKSEKKTAV